VLSEPDALALVDVTADEIVPEAGKLRDAGHGDRITFSPKVFVPLTMLCRDRCGYCTFAKPPARLEAPFLDLETVLALARHGAALGCHEALFTLGEAPEARYPDAAAYAAADRDELEALIRPTGFFRAKAGSLIGLGQALCERYDGEVPGRLRDLVTLPGVGRKTANVVLGNAFGVPGITVDTHLGRLARRFGWTLETDPEKVEAELMTLIPRRDWTMMSHRVIFHGRRCCHARKPACGACALARMCPAYGEGPTDPDVAAKLITTEGRA